MMGELGILNVGAGDTKLSFDPKNPQECIRAARIVKDMLRRGYALLVQDGTHASGEPIYRRALDFDDTKFEYIIADFDPVEAAKAEEEAGAEAAAVGDEPKETPQAENGKSAEVPRRPRGRTSKKRIPAAKTRGVTVARSAGG